jgi:hypothetical protein
MPTKLGPLTLMFRLAGNGCWLRFGGQRPQGGFLMYWPASIQAKFYDGHTTQQPDAEGKMLWPADVSEVRIWFRDPLVPQKGKDTRGR